MVFAWGYDYDPELTFMNQPKLLRGLYSILLVSLLMTLFELAFYRIVIDPETTKAVRGILNSMENGFYDILTKEESSKFVKPETIQMAREVNLVDSFLLTSAEREEKLIERVNLYAYLTASFMVFILMGALYYVHSHLLFVRSRRHVLTVFGDNYGAAIVTALLTVILLASFQYLFYLFGAQFRFVGRNGLEELQNTFNNALRTNLGLPVVD